MSAWFRSYGFAEVHERLVIGAMPSDESDVRMLSELGVTSVLNLVADREYASGARARVEKALEQAGITEERLHSQDYGNLAAPLLDDAVRVASEWLDHGQLVYLHCRAGWQRSATVAAAVVAAREQLDPDRALEQIRARKPTADPLPHQKDDLRAWWNGRDFNRRARGAPELRP